MFKAYGRFWKHIFNYKGRADRKEYWWPMLLNALIIGGCVIGINSTHNYAPLVYAFYGLCALMALARISCTVRRLRHAGHKWTNVFWLLLPCIGWFALLLLCSLKQGAACTKHTFVHDEKNCVDVCSNCGITQPHHSFKGCKCAYCGETRDSNHNFAKFDKEKCLDICVDCGKTRKHHSWQFCKCTVCGAKQDLNHHFMRVEGTCTEKCTECGKVRAEAHDYVRMEGKCEERCTRCGKVRTLEHKYDVSGVCTVCGSRDPKPFTLSTLTTAEIDSVKFACGLVKDATGLNDFNKKLLTDLNRNLTSARKLDAVELAIIAITVQKILQEMAKNKDVTNTNNNNFGALMLRLHLVNLFTAQKKIGDLLDKINSESNSAPAASADKGQGTADSAAGFVKKPLSSFPSFDESYQGYKKGGLCDVCNAPLEGKKAYAVDNKTFYDSPEYYAHFAKIQKTFGITLTKADYERQRKRDTSPGSAVCENCIHMFADMSAYAPAETDTAEKKYYERDNCGSRHDTMAQANGYWMGERFKKEVKPPFTMYSFSSYADGEAALLELPFIHKAADTGKLICDRLMTFGIYEVTSNGKPAGLYEALVCGSDLTKEEFLAAEEAFKKHNGKRKNNLEPEEGVKPVRAEDGDAARVRFKENVHDNGYTYKVHTAPKKADALAFLKQQRVNIGKFYIVVETPEGNIGRDINGIYEE